MKTPKELAQEFTKQFEKDLESLIQQAQDKGVSLDLIASYLFVVLSNKYIEESAEIIDVMKALSLYNLSVDFSNLGVAELMKDSKDKSKLN